MHRGAFTRSNKLKLAAVLREQPLAGAFGNSLAPRKSRLFPTKFLFHELFSKNIRNIFLQQVSIQKLSSPHCDGTEGREIRRSRRGASALKYDILKLKDRITPHVTNFFRLRLTIVYLSIYLSIYQSIYLSI